MSMNDTTLRDRFRGALLGTMVGDALGAPFEGSDPEFVARIVDEYQDLPAVERARHNALFGILLGGVVVPGSARYTDDTQMMIGLAESLIEHPSLDGPDLAARFVANFQPHRGYGAGAAAVIQEWAKGEPWDTVGGLLFGGQGSFGNGAAMRVAPVGALYHDDRLRVRQVAAAQAVLTHTNPLGRQGAQIQAAAVAAALRLDIQNDDFDPGAFIDDIMETVGPVERWMNAGMDDVRTLLRLRPNVIEVMETLGNGIEAHLSVPAAVYAFAAHYDSFSEAVRFAIHLGGDTDTIAAMTGAIAGALHGASGIPPNWREAMEDSDLGRDYVLTLADRLFDVWRGQRRPDAGRN